MTVLDRRLELAADLDELAELLHPPGLDSAGPRRHSDHRLSVALSELQRRLREDRLRILVVGESKRGKSTFTNALIGRTVLPMGVTPLTAVATTVTYGSPSRVEVSTRRGAMAVQSLTALAGLVTEDGNPGNCKELGGVVVFVDAPLLAEGVELVDTPGTGSVNAANDAEADIAYQAMDAAIVVLTADPPISAAERTLLERILPSSVRTFVILNKADRLTADELRVATDFTERTVATAAGRPLPVLVCSAREALLDSTERVNAPHGEDSQVHGIDSFLREFREFLRTSRASGLLNSLRRQGSGIVAQLLDEAAVTLRAEDLARQGDERQVALFRHHIDELEQHHRDAVDLVNGEARRMLADLNADATRFEDHLAGQVHRELRGWLADGSTRSGAAIESEGHDRASESIRDAVERWRSAQAGAVQARLDALDARLRAGLDRELAALRPVTRQLLGIDLAAEPADITLAPAQRFYYRFRIDLDAASMLASAIRHRLPGQLGRSRAEHYLLDQMDLLARQQVGRARADLQQRLAVSSRSMLAALAVRYADHGTRLLDALDAAGALLHTDVERAAAQRRHLNQRQHALTRLLARMTADEPKGTVIAAQPGGSEVRTLER